MVHREEEGRKGSELISHSFVLPDSSETLPLYKQLANGDLTLSPILGYDVITALTAKVSRSPDGGYIARLTELVMECYKNGEKLPTFSNPIAWIDDPPSTVVNFCKRVFSSYGHKSPADCCGPVLYLDNIGWPGAWLIEDFPLWNGQENSTRAVTRNGKLGKCCSLAPKLAEELHDDWMEVYESEIIRLTREVPNTIKDDFSAKRWVLDHARWALPGTTSTGVATTTSIRPVVRHIDHIRAIGEEYTSFLADRLMDVAVLASSSVASHLSRNRSRLSHHKSAFEVSNLFVDDQLIFPWNYRNIMHIIGRINDDNPSDYLDAGYAKQLPNVFLGFNTSIAAARDWHRHRPVMPWYINVVCDNNLIKIASWVSADSLNKCKSLLEKTNKAWIDTKNEEGIWAAAHCLPFGTMVYLRCSGYLDKVLYMLELRSRTKGANFEYKETATDLLYTLRNVMSDCL